MKRSGFEMSFPSSKGSAQLTPASRLLGTLFFLAFFLMGSMFEVFVVREFVIILRTYAWRQTPCRILASEVVSNEGDYRFAVRYEYTVGSATFVGEKFKRNFHNGDYDKQAGRVQQYSVGNPAVCWVNPADPSEAILQRDSLFFGLILLFPLIFIGIGAIGIYAMWARRTPKPAENRPISDSSKGRRFLLAFFVLFALVGLGMMWPLCVRPIYKVIDARDWIETSCRIIQARVQSHDGDEGTTYSVDILYEYSFGGKTYRSNRYDFIGGSSSGYQGKQAVVDRYKSIFDPVCYVNPASPAEAVLVRKATAKLLICLFPWVFFLVGAGGIYGVLHSAARSAQGGPAAWLPPASETGRAVGPGNMHWLRPSVEDDFRDDWITLPAAGRRAGKFFGWLFIAAFWNGIISVFIVMAIQSFRRGHPDWFLSLFMIPFVLIGLGLTLAACHQFLALFNPYPVARIRPGRIALGTSADLQWEFKGVPSRIRELKIVLTATEQIRNASDENKRNRNVSMSSKPVFERELLCLTDSQQIASGQIRLSIPPSAMHSFDSGNCRLIWAVSFRGDIRIWPNLKDDLMIVVIPSNLQESA